jgi:hypothetical protein
MAQNFYLKVYSSEIFFLLMNRPNIKWLVQQSYVF